MRENTWPRDQHTGPGGGRYTGPDGGLYTGPGGGAHTGPGGGMYIGPGGGMNTGPGGGLYSGPDGGMYTGCLDRLSRKLRNARHRAAHPLTYALSMFASRPNHGFTGPARETAQVAQFKRQKANRYARPMSM